MARRRTVPIAATTAGAAVVAVGLVALAGGFSGSRAASVHRVAGRTQFAARSVDEQAAGPPVAPTTGEAAGGRAPVTAAASGAGAPAPAGTATAGSTAVTTSPTGAASSPTAVTPAGASPGGTGAQVSPGSSSVATASSPASAGASAGSGTASSGAPAGSGFGGGTDVASVTVVDPDGGAVPAAGTVAFTATLHPPAGAPAPVGTVVFTVSGPSTTAPTTACRVAVASDHATCPVTLSAAGTYEVAAYFEPGTGVGGAATYVPSQGSEQVTVST